MEQVFRAFTIEILHNKKNIKSETKVFKTKDTDIIIVILQFELLYEEEEDTD